jgi:hypothetical protein
LAPLPYLFWRGAVGLVGDGPAARSAAFLPMIIPALSRLGATINNDNLAILAATAVLVALVGVFRGDMGRGRALAVAIPVAVMLWAKGTALLLCPVVLLAYLVGWWRSGGRFPWPAAIRVGIGALVGLSWWVANLVRYGKFQPNGFGADWESYAGPLRTSDNPLDVPKFLGFLLHVMPTRFWGMLGELEPPFLPGWVVWSLTGLMVVGLLVFLVVSRCGRWIATVLWLAGLAALAVVIYKGYAFAATYVRTGGLQARYAFPFLFGMLAPMAVGFGLALRRFARWLPLALSAIGVAITSLSFILWINLMMLPDGESLRPGTVGRAYRNIARFFPVPTWVSLGLILLVLAGFAGTVIMTALSAIRSRPALGSDAIDREDQRKLAL